VRFTAVSAHERHRRLAYEAGCQRVARLLTNPAAATKDDAAYFLEWLRKAFVDPPSMVTFSVDATGALVVSEVQPDAVVHWREGQKSVVQYIEHAIEVGRGRQ